MRERIIVFGDVIDDVVVVPHGEIRDDTDTVSSIRLLPGGSAANTASWLGSLAREVDFVGCVGTADVERHGLLLRAASATPHLSAHAELPTGTIVVIAQGERRTMLTERGANAALDPAAVTERMLASATLLHLTGHVLRNSAGVDGVRSLIDRARQAGVTVSIDPGSAGFIHDYGPSRFLDALEGADLLFPSRDEGTILTGLVEPRLIAARLGEMFATVILTLGADGVVAIHGGDVTVHPATPVTTIDPTGAGDAFTAGFLDDWLRYHDVSSAVRNGAQLAARAVRTMGGRPDFSL